jgi:hypothetical protein
MKFRGPVGDGQYARALAPTSRQEEPYRQKAQSNGEDCERIPLFSEVYWREGSGVGTPVGKARAKFGKFDSLLWSDLTAFCGICQKSELCANSPND